MENQKQLQVQTGQIVLKVCKIQDLCKIISLCQIADINFKLSSEHIKFIAEEIQKDFPEMDFVKFKNIILFGIKGKYDSLTYQMPINSRTIYSWINKTEKSVNEYKGFVSLEEAGGKNVLQPGQKSILEQIEDGDIEIINGEIKQIQ